MLTSLQIHHFAIVQSLELEFYDRMTTITGETGAGKSIAIEALNLCLGGRAEPGMIRQNQNKADLIATFNLTNLPEALAWLKAHDLDEQDECLLRRVLTKEGRSRAYINGHSVPVSQQKKLGQLLVNIHGQHAHQLLTTRQYQLSLLDQFANHESLLQKMRQDIETLKQYQQTHTDLIEQKNALESKKQLLEYQVQELNELALSENEFANIEIEHKQLSHGDEILSTGERALNFVSDANHTNALTITQHALKELNTLIDIDEHFLPIQHLLENAQIQLQEASQELQIRLSQFELDPVRLNYLDQRLAAIHVLARKHRVSACDLHPTHQGLIKSLEAIGNIDEVISQACAKVIQQQKNCQRTAKALSQNRRKAAKKLCKLMTQSMTELNMLHGQFDIIIQSDDDRISETGADQITFLLSTNIGQTLQPLSKIASGGELSRLALAMQVITQQDQQGPTLIFDEIDVGISGQTASIIGNLLRRLGRKTQILCVTHLPQVAACGHQQMFVHKTDELAQTCTQMTLLDERMRVYEIARLLGGSQITPSSLTNAQELLEEVS